MPTFFPITIAANATVNGTAFTGRINVDNIVFITASGGIASVTMIGGTVISIPTAWIQANWSPLFTDMWTVA